MKPCLKPRKTKLGRAGKISGRYVRRDKTLIDFRRLLCGSGLEVIGTGGIVLGMGGVFSATRSERLGAGRPSDIPNAQIHILGDVAWLSVTGTVNMELQPKSLSKIS